eukprot:GDKJ01032202.1.p1 GENE.GDKJ01032202.1~~GDKJ01032202.1.p1  ORF type:complete len:177 (-),score=7.13 GDKJ01032202.1:218-748(-)
MPHVCNIFTAAFMIAATCCAVVGVAGSQYKGEFTTALTGIETKIFVFLYKIRTEVNGDSNEEHYNRDDFDCKAYYDKLTTSFAFGLIACVTSLVAVVLAFVRMCTKGLSRSAPAFFCFASMVAFIVAFAISVSTFTMKQCDAESYQERDFKVDWGLAILIGGSGLSLIGTILALAF